MKKTHLAFEKITQFLVYALVFFLSNSVFGQSTQISSKIDASDYLENVNVQVDGVEAKISWNLKYDKIPLDGYLVIRSLNENQTKLNTNPDWILSPKISSSSTSYTLKNLPVNEEITFSIGIHFQNQPESKIVWLKNTNFQTDRGWTFGQGLGMRILMLLGALALFIYGMIIMSEGIQKAAGQRLRRILGSITSSRFKGIFTGFLTTSIVQSSSATTVMVVSFVNAGLLNLKQSISLIMGANVGTTITAWLVAFLGFSVSMSDYALPLLLFGLIFIFINKKNLKAWGEFMAGFALLFIGLELLKSGIPDLKDSIESLKFLHSLSKHGFGSVLIFVLIGTVITMIVQSSSAAMAVTILLCERGIIPFEMAAGMVLGENIGTTITANLAAIVANVHAKRAARSHFVFNVFGVLWCLAIFYPYLGFIDYIITSFGLESPYVDQASRPVSLALFHTLFNLFNVIILVGFTNFIVKTVTKMVPSRAEGDEEFKLEYIAGGMLSTPELSLLEAKKEIGKFGERTAKMNLMFKELLFEKDKKTTKKILDRIEKYEIITDTLREEIMHYLSRCSEDDLSNESHLKVRAYMAINNDLERIGDIFYQMSLVYKKKEEEKVWFSPEQRNNIKSMLVQLEAAFKTMNSNLVLPSSKLNYEEASKNETAIDQLRNRLREENDSSLESDEFNVKSNVVYTDLIFSCERIGDLILNVSRELKLKRP